MWIIHNFSNKFQDSVGTSMHSFLRLQLYTSSQTSDKSHLVHFPYIYKHKVTLLPDRRIK